MTLEFLFDKQSANVFHHLNIKKNCLELRQCDILCSNSFNIPFNFDSMKLQFKGHFLCEFRVRFPSKFVKKDF